MRIGLLAALRRTETGDLRGELPLVGRSVLAWQAALLQQLGAERVLCLCETSGGVVLELQHSVEVGGAAFHALHGFAALPALVRAEDDLIILRDGLVPDPGVAHALLGGGGGALRRVIAALPADHPLAAAYPEDFERIDAARHWAGVLAMRGAPVQQLADFPGDADPVSLLLRLALQAGTPCRDLAARELVPDTWLLADGPHAVAGYEAALIARAAPTADWRAPLAALAVELARALALRGIGLRGIGLGHGDVVAGGLALALLLAAVLTAGFGLPAAGLGLAGLGAFVAQVAVSYLALTARLRRAAPATRRHAELAGAVDALAALSLWFALAPWPQWQPLAVLGPLVIGLARLAARAGGSALAAPAADRASLLLALALAAVAGLLPEILACLALVLLAALLRRV
jgi:hypothetical protein